MMSLAPKARMRRLLLLIAATLAPGLAARPAAAQIGVPPPPVFSAVDRNGVDMVGGSLTLNRGSVSIGPAEGGLSNSITQHHDINGTPYFRHSLPGGINEDYSPSMPTLRRFTVTLFGESMMFRESNPGTFLLQTGRGGMLTRGGAGYIFTASDGTVAEYSGALTSWNDDAMANEASLVSVTRPNGERMTYHYVGTSGVDLRLQSVTNNYGYQIHFQYPTSTGGAAKVEAINNAIDPCSPTANVCPTFSRPWPTLTSNGGLGWVDSEGRLPVSSPAGVIWTSGSPYIAWTVLPGGGTVVQSVSDGAGTWTYDYGPPPTEGTIEDTSTNTITDPLGRVTTVTMRWVMNFDYYPELWEPTLESVEDPEGNVTTYAIGRKVLRGITQPEGNSQSWTYDYLGRTTSVTRNPKPGSGLSPTSVDMTYADTSTPIRMRRPTSITDERGAVTDYTYDAAGNVLTVTGPAPTPGAPRPQTRYVWQQRYAWYKQNGAAAITQAATPVWVMVEQSQCMTGATC